MKWWALRAAPVPAWAAVVMAGLMLVIGSLLATPDETTPESPTPSSTVAQITDESVQRLADALEHATTTGTVPPGSGLAPAVDEARRVLGAVDSGAVQVTPSPTSTTQTTTSTTTTVPTTTTTAPVGSRHNPVTFGDTPPSTMFP